jgi:hypothetical protein
MSTRTNILVTFGESTVYLYRHHDGYPSETGADLVTKLRGCEGSADKFLHALLAEQYEATSYCGPRNIYELTSEVHGDIKWAYSVLFYRYGDKSPTIGAAQCPFDEDTDVGMARARASRMTPDDFVRKLVNPEIVAENQRLAQLRQGGTKLYAAVTDRPLLEVA